MAAEANEIAIEENTDESNEIDLEETTDESNEIDLEETTDESNEIDLEETTDPSMDSTRGENEDGNTVVYRLHEEIDNLNLVLDHLERKNGDIYSRIEQLLASFQNNETEEE